MPDTINKKEYREDVARGKRMWYLSRKVGNRKFYVRYMLDSYRTLCGIENKHFNRVSVRELNKTGLSIEDLMYVHVHRT